MSTRYLIRRVNWFAEASCKAAMFVIGVSLVAGAAPQEVAWRYDYNSARREASEKGIPLILDFGTENCFWCKRLEESTFRDPSVLGVVNDHFVPLKLDAARNAFLTEALHVQSFPTIVLAASDGKILGTFEGYMEAPRMLEVLQSAMAASSSPEWMTRDYDEAVKAVAAAEFTRALGLLKPVLADGKATPVQQKARELLGEIQQQAALRLAKARQLDESGQTNEASNLLAELTRTFPGTDAATEGAQLLQALKARPEVRAQQRATRARELLAQAREDYRSKQYLCCLDRCESLVANFADLPEGTEASQFLTEIKNNPEWLREACDSLADRLGFLYLAQAETWLKTGQPQQAIYCLERVLRTFPGTRQAEAAQARLAQLQGQPAPHTEFKAPAPPAAAQLTEKPLAVKPGS